MTCLNDVILYLLQCFHLEVNLLIGVLAFVVLVSDEVFHLVAQQFYLRHASNKALQHLDILFAVVDDEVIDDLLHCVVAKHNLAPPHSIELLVIEVGLFVVSANRVHSGVDMRKEEAELVHHAIKGNMTLWIRASCFVLQ